MEEYLDIVDEKGNLTGEKELRSVVHEKGLWHRTVHIYFFRIKNREIELIVHLRSKFKDQKPNRWDTRFGGHVVFGKTVTTTVLNEIKEETGLKIKMKDLTRGKTEKYDGSKNKEVVSAFYYNFSGNISNLQFNDGEVQQVKWMNESKIAKSIKSNPEIWTGGIERFLENINYLKNKI